MHLILDLPADWIRERHSDGSLHATNDALETSGLVHIYSSAMTVRESKFIKWSHIVIADDLGASAELLRDRNAHTSVGWPVRIALAHRTDGDRRLYGFYHFLDYGCWAAIHAERDTLDTLIDQLEALLLTGYPDFRTDDVVALLQLWE